MTLAEAKAYLARHGLTPEAIKERKCGCRLCVEARRAEQLETVKRAIRGFARAKTITLITKGRNV